MQKKSFFGLVIPQFEYERLPAILPELEKVAASKSVTLFHEKHSNHNPAASIQVGDKVKTGQKISLFADDPTYVIASATGTVSAISPHTGDFGKTYAAITINIDEDENLDDQFEIQKQTYQPAGYRVEGDWSSASYLLALGALSGGVEVGNLSSESLQGDKAIPFEILFKVMYTCSKSDLYKMRLLTVSKTR